MSELRQRKTAPGQPATGTGVAKVKTVTVTDASDDEAEDLDDNKKYTAKDRLGRSPLLSPSKGASGPTTRSTPPPSSPKNSLLGLLLPILLILGIAGVTLSNLTLTKQERYAICSREGQVYITSNKSTECVVVHQDIVEFYGTIEETRTKFGDVDTLGSLAVWPGRASNNAGLKIYYTRSSWGVYPGFTDAHGHIMGFGHSLSIANIGNSRSKEEVVSRLVTYINRLPRKDKTHYGKVIEGHGFDQTKWPGGAFPTAEDLNVGALRGRKIFLTRVDIHACWISTALLNTLDVPDHIPGGVILRYPDGRPTGVFLDTAFEWVQSQLPKWSQEEWIKYYQIAMDKLLLAGITGVHDAATSPEAIKFFRALDQRRQLPIRIYGMAACPKLDEYCGDDIEAYDGDHFTLRASKLFLDGALGSWGAAMLEPYSDNPTEKGITRMSPDTLRHLVQSWHAKGFQPNTHAIGDAANRIAIDIYEETLQKSGKTNDELRFRIEHAQILAPEDIQKAGKLGLISSVQPTHATSDMGYAESRLGSERVKGAYAWQSLARAGSPLVLGSDFPVERILPQEGFHASISRLNSSNDSPHGPGGWYPSETLTRQQALEGFTSGAAYARFAEHKLGKLEVGYKADITIYDKDIMKVPMEDIRKTWARITIVDGVVRYGKLR